jgi:hypothetical protein
VKSRQSNSLLFKNRHFIPNSFSFSHVKSSQSFHRAMRAFARIIRLSAAPTPMTVYDSTRVLGEIEDHGRGDVRAFRLTESGRVAIGTFPDRRTAMRAVSSAAEAQRRLTEPAPFRSGLPG